MKKFIHKVQTLGAKAAEIKQMVEAMPDKAARLREAVAITAGELQQVRADVQSNLGALRVNSEERLIQAMREINDSAAVFREAGYQLAAVDLDFALNQRLAVHLDKVDDCSPASLRTIVARENRPTIKSILSGLLRAEEMATKVELTELRYQGVTVHVGQTPAIRMCWIGAAPGPQQPSLTAAVPSASAPSFSGSPAFGSFFEQRPTAAASPGAALTSATPNAPPRAETPALPPSAVAGETLPTNRPWSREALDRFKKMPDLSKYGR